MPATEWIALEARRMLTSLLLPGPIAHPLVVNGTSHADVIQIERQTIKHVRYVRVTVNGKTTRASAVSSVEVHGRAGDDRITDLDGYDAGPFGAVVTITGDGGNDRVVSTSPRVWIRGGSGNDSVAASGAGATLIGDDGDDRLSGGVEIEGGGGDDVLTAGAAGARLAGDDGDDELVGGVGNDTLLGEDGNDTLLGGAGDDALIGGAGGDRIDGQAGRDLDTNGETAAARGDVNGNGIVDADEAARPYGSTFDAPIHITFDGVANDGRAGEQDNVLDAEVLVGSTDDDVIDCSLAPAGVTIPEGMNAGTDSIIGSAFADFLSASDPTSYDGQTHTGLGSTVRGGAGDDTIVTGIGEDSVSGEAGDDRIVDDEGAYAYPDVLDGGSGNDRITTGNGDDTVIGGAGNDRVYSGGEPFWRHVLRGGSGRDTVWGDDDGDDVAGFESHG